MAERATLGGPGGGIRLRKGRKTPFYWMFYLFIYLFIYFCAFFRGNCLGVGFVDQYSGASF